MTDPMNPTEHPPATTEFVHDTSAKGGARRRRREDSPDRLDDDARSGTAPEDAAPAAAVAVEAAPELAAAAAPSDDAGNDERSHEKSLAAMGTWLVGAALAAGSAVTLVGGDGKSDSHGEEKAGPSPRPPMPPRPGPDAGDGSRPVPGKDRGEGSGKPPEPGDGKKPDGGKKPDQGDTSNGGDKSDGRGHPDGGDKSDGGDKPDGGDLKPGPEPQRVPMETVVMRPVIALVNDTGTADDRITRDAEIAVTGIEPDNVWTYRIGDGPWKNGSGNLIAASEFGADGDHLVEVQQRDAAGNASSATLAFKLVHAAAAPTLSLAQDTGASAADRITSVATVKVGGLANGGAWEYSLNGIDWADGVGDSIHASVFGRDGPQRVYVRHTDGGGNPSPSAQLDFTLDTQAAKPDCVLRSAARDNYPIANTKAGSSLFHTGNDVNRDSWIQVKQEAGAMAWRYSLDGGASYQTGSGDRISLGSVKPGAMEVWVQQQDVAGNWSSERAVTLNVDLQAPTVSAQYFWRTTDGRLSQRTAFTADEDVQVLFIPVDTANDGTPSSYLTAG